jgi:hypothetical protein
VTKKQLLEGVWPSAVVEDNNINQCVLAIRRALGESAGTNRFIMTVPGRGYRFVAQVHLQQRESPEPAAAEPSTTDFWRRRMAVILPAIPLAVILVVVGLGSFRKPVHPAVAATHELVMHLRRSNDSPSAPQTDRLLACLQQRPDLHLLIEVSVVGEASAQPVWKGRYVAGAQDMIPDRSSSDPEPDACQNLAAR